MNIQIKSSSLYILLSISILVICAGCNVYKTIYVDPITEESLSSVYSIKKNVVISNVSKSNGTTLRRELVLRNVKISPDKISGILKSPPEGAKHRFHKKSFTKNKVKAYDPMNTMHIYTTESSIDTGYFELPIDRIQSVELHEKDYFASIAGTTGIIAVAGGATLAVAVIITCACPQVSSYTSTESQYHGSLFPGAIFKSLKRTDHLILEDVVSEQGDLHIRIANELPEREYIDQVQILEVDHTGFMNLGVNDQNEFVAFNETHPAQDIRSHDQSILDKLTASDSIVFDFDNSEIRNELNSIVLKFDRTTFSSHPYLYIKGKQAKWLETVANYSFYNIGKSYDNWVKRKDKANPDKWKKRNIKQGISLNVYLKINEKWKYIGSHHDAGTMAMRNLMMAIDLEHQTTDSIEIKLECAYKLWELDYVGLTDNWQNELPIQEIKISTASNETGQDILSKISNIDNDDYTLDDSGTHIDVWAKGVNVSTQYSIVLQGTGYYHHIKDYKHKADLQFAAKVNSKRGVQDISRDLYHYQTLMTYVEN